MVIICLLFLSFFVVFITDTSIAVQNEEVEYPLTAYKSVNSIPKIDGERGDNEWYAQAINYSVYNNVGGLFLEYTDKWLYIRYRGSNDIDFINIRYDDDESGLVFFNNDTVYCSSSLDVDYYSDPKAKVAYTYYDYVEENERGVFHHKYDYYELKMSMEYIDTSVQYPPFDLYMGDVRVSTYYNRTTHNNQTHVDLSLSNKIYEGSLYLSQRDDIPDTGRPFSNTFYKISQNMGWFFFALFLIAIGAVFFYWYSKEMEKEYQESQDPPEAKGKDL